MSDFNDEIWKQRPTPTFGRRPRPLDTEPRRPSALRKGLSEAVYLLGRLLDETRAGQNADRAERARMQQALSAQAQTLAALLDVVTAQRDEILHLRQEVGTLFQAAQVLAHGQVLPTPPAPRAQPTQHPHAPRTPIGQPIPPRVKKGGGW